MARSSTAGSLTADPLGSHLFLRATSATAAHNASRIRLAQQVEDEWIVPAVPAGVRSLRAFLGDNRGVTIEPDAERLLRAVEGVHGAARAVIHLCEHKPGRRGIVVVGEPECDLEGTVTRMSGWRRDWPLDRWWAPLGADGDERVIRALLEATPWLSATQEARAELERHVQPSLSVEAVAGLEHRCTLSVRLAPGGEARLAVCRRCHPDIDLPGDVSSTYDSWLAPIDESSHARLRELVIELGGESSVLAALDEAGAAAGAGAAMERLSTARDGAFPVPGLAGALHPFQAAAVDYAVRARRTFLADEPGLGKTVQALATLEAADAFPALVACPASLRLNWLRETERWLPGRTAVAGLDGDADLRIVSYDVLHRLAERPDQWKGFVLDEAHYCKTPSARRTRAAQAIAASLPEDAIVLALTGTPVVNRPEELGPQLEVLGRMDDVGGARRFTRVHARGRELDVLHRRLRRTCFVRRRKSEVLTQLPDKQRVIVPLALADRGEYDRVQADVAIWLREQAQADEAFLASIEGLEDVARDEALRARGREASQRARKAAGLVRLGQLSMAAARGKLAPAIEWIGAFLETDEKLVVFCRHREIGDALHEAFPGAALATGKLAADERQAEVRRFQSDADCRLIVCSLDAAGVGVTLTAASNVALLEMGWTPAINDQAEDRVHRIGQDSAVTAWYLLAADTIDERVAEVVARKRRIVDATSDGLAPARRSPSGLAGKPGARVVRLMGDDDAAVTDELLAWIADRGEPVEA